MPPAAATPAATAASSISPDARVSRMTSTRGRSEPLPTALARVVAARPSASVSSAVRNSPATPRTPSVPNSRRATEGKLALRELRPLAGLLEAGLLALLRACVTREEAAALELATQVRIGLEQGARDAMAQRAGLRRDAAAVELRDHVHARLVSDRLKRLADVALERGAREKVVERLAVDDVLAGARLERHARDGRLALAGGGVARTRGKRDRCVGDRLHVGLVLAIDGGDGLAVLVVGRRLAECLALEHDVRHEAGTGDLRLDARRLLDQLLLDGRRGLSCRLLGRGRLSSRGLLGDGLLGGRLGRRRLGVGSRLGRVARGLGSRRLLGGDGLLNGRVGLRGALLVLRLLDVGHEEISMGCGCWAACG